MNLLPLIMFIGLVVTIAIGIPIAFSTTIIGLISAYFLWGSGTLYSLLNAVTAISKNWVLLAVPLFTFMSFVLFETKAIDDLYETLYKWTGSLRGGLTIATVAAGTLLGATTGSASGSVVALGTLGLPQMLKRQYDKKLSMGSVLVGGTLGQLIPPSTNMIVYGAVTGVSVGSLFACGISAGLLLSLLFIIYILGRSYLNKKMCPLIPVNERPTLKEKLIATKGVVLPVLLILGVLGSIFSGLATPTEASSVGSVGAVLIAIVKKRFSWRAMKEASIKTLRITAMVAWIAIGATYFGSVFTAVGGDKLVIKFFEIIPFGGFGKLFAIMLILYFLGMFLETTAIILISAPILQSVALSVGFDPLWFAMLVMVNLQAAYITPPFGSSLFYLKGVVTEDTSILDIYKSALPFIAIDIICLLLIIIFPILTLWGDKFFV